MDQNSRIWRRRARTFSMILAMWVGSIVLAPLLLMAAAAVDAVRSLSGNTTFTATRLLVVAWVYLTAEIIGVAAAGMHFMLSGFGTSNNLLRWSYQLQGRWTNFMLLVVTKAFSMTVEVSGLDQAKPGPYILMMRHASMIDVLIPAALIAHRGGIRLRWILKRELLSDPALDIVGSRLPNHFVDRSGSNREDELAAIRDLSRDLGPEDAVMIYPEGTRFTEQKRDSSIRRMSKIHPELAGRFSSLKHVLAPQPGGSLALLESGYDVVFGTHTGLDGMASLREIWSGSLVGTAIRVSFWRVSARDIPDGESDRLRWLVERWVDLDRKTAELQSSETLRAG
ncbi:MAG: lysophospholipid acyltransferase family protein [Acidimicrobiia bacterium]|nr:lysophospholipid acyltransferase family protein [Acidimicrobiia bacterium]